MDHSLETLVPQVCTGSFISVPSSTEEYVLGIDEAGRGPVLGPMVYGGAWCTVSFEKQLRDRFGVNDSKQLTEESRESIFHSMLHDPANRHVGCAVRVLSPSYLSAEMLAPDRLSLNELSFRAAFRLLRTALDSGVRVTKVFVDTVGDPDKYRKKWQDEFWPANAEIEFVVSKKADSLFPIVGAASIVAKVVRDAIVKAWPFIEGIETDTKGVGSGYPGDPATKSWLQRNGDRVFGFPSIVRFSWQTTKTLLDSKAFVPVLWGDEDQFVSGAWNEDEPSPPAPKISKLAAATRKDPNQSKLSFSAPKKDKEASDPSAVFKRFGISAYTMHIDE